MENKHHTHEHPHPPSSRLSSLFTTAAFAADDDGLTPGPSGQAAPAKAIPDRCIVELCGGLNPRAVATAHGVVPKFVYQKPLQPLGIGSYSAFIGTAQDENGHGTHVAGTIAVIVAAGNEATLEVSQQIPSAYPEVIAIASNTAKAGTNANRDFSGVIGADTASHFTSDGAFNSTTGIGVGISAPGATQENITKSGFVESVGILSTKLGGGTTSMSGTSMACPHTAGVAALVWQKALVLGQTASPRATCCHFAVAACCERACRVAARWMTAISTSGQQAASSSRIWASQVRRGFTRLPHARI